MADSQSILQLGIEAARAGDKAEARELFRLVTREDPGNAQGWLWLAGVAEDREEKRAALEQVVQIDPSNELARKGLAALGGAAAARTVAPAAPPATTPPRTTPPIAPTDRDAGDALDVNDTSAPVDSGRAQVYTQPEQATRSTPPAYNDDDYDLSEYQTGPTTARDDATDRDTVVVVEDEEPRRRGFAAFWPLLLIGLVTLGVLLFLLARNFGGNNLAAVDPNASAAVVGADGSAAPPEGSGPGEAPEASSDATGLLTSPGADTGGNAAAAGTEGSAAAGTEGAAGVGTKGSAAAGTEGSAAAGTEGSAGVGTEGSAAAAPGDTGQASAPTDGAAPAASDGAAPAASDGAAPAASDGAAPAPVDGTASAPADVAASAPAPAASEAPTPAPSVAAEPAPPAPADVATANPAIVGNNQLLRAGDFEYSFSGLSNVATGSYGGAPPARGRYLIALMTVRNVGNTPAQIPDGFFVVKDAQGRVSDFNRAASVDYLNRFGGAGPRGAGDFAANATLPPRGQLGSVPLLFDVPSDATDLVVFSRDNTAQGFLVRQSAR